MKHIRVALANNRYWAIFATILFFSGLIRYLYTYGDYEVFFAAAERFLVGAQVHMREENAYTYPTGSLVFWVPLSLLGHTVSKIIFFLLNFAFLFYGLRIVHKNLHIPSQSFTFAVFLSIIACFRFMTSLFNNQQSDGIVFGLVLMGIQHLQKSSLCSGVAFAAATVIKSNPLYMLLLPLLNKKFAVASTLIIAVIALTLIPEATKYAINPLTEKQVVFYPTKILNKNQEIPMRKFNFKPAERSHFSYLREFVELNINSKSKWWENTDGYLNQSLTRVVKRNFQHLPGNFIVFGLCALFGSLLLFLAITSKGFYFEKGILTYAAFVLIGPVSSKPHFIAFYPVLLYTWINAFKNKSRLEIAILTVCTLLISLSSQGILGNLAYDLALRGHIAIAGLVAWLLAYTICVRSTRNVKKFMN